jgi:hypothetical protein
MLATFLALRLLLSATEQIRGTRFTFHYEIHKKVQKFYALLATNLNAFGSNRPHLYLTRFVREKLKQNVSLEIFQKGVSADTQHPTAI